MFEIKYDIVKKKKQKQKQALYTPFWRDYQLPYPSYYFQFHEKIKSIYLPQRNNLFKLLNWSLLVTKK